jgi:hypothetical protein
MGKVKDTLLFIIDGEIWGSHLVGHPDERKSSSEEPFIGNSDKRKGSFISNETHCLLGIREQSGGAWWLENCLRGEVGIYSHSDDSVAISLDTRGNNMVDDMEPVLEEY